MESNNIITKTFPKCLPFTIFETKIDDKEMDKELIEIIDKRGDEQNHTSNVKAQMTSYDMKDEKPFKKLISYMDKAIVSSCMDIYKTKPLLTFRDIWGMKYKSNEEAIPHNHFPAFFSCVYYVNVPEGCPGIVFTDCDIMKKPYNGLLLLFEGNINHHVPKVEYEGYRYVVAGNCYLKHFERF